MDKYTVSDDLAEFHKLAEGFKNTTYRDNGGVLTIGIGHANQDTAAFQEGDTWSDRQCLDVWRADVDVAERHADSNLCRDDVPQRLFDAYVDLIFNTGIIPSTITKFMNEGNYEAATRQLARWVYVNGVVVAGLVKRRMAMIAYVRGLDWKMILNFPLKSAKQESIDEFNKVIAKLGFKLVSKPETKSKFAVVELDE